MNLDYRFKGWAMWLEIYIEIQYKACAIRICIAVGLEI